MSVFEAQHATASMRKHDIEMNKHRTYEYPCEAHLTWCCGGDRGARHLITDPAWPVRWVEVDDPGVRIDVDTPQALTAVEAGPAPT